MTMKAFFISTLLTLTLGQSCRDFSFDLCEFDEDGNGILWSGNTESSQECQNKCKEIGQNCQIFRFNLQNGYCYALNYTLQGEN